MSSPPTDHEVLVERLREHEPSCSGWRLMQDAADALIHADHHADMVEQERDAANRRAEKAADEIERLTAYAEKQVRATMDVAGQRDDFAADVRRLTAEHDALANAVCHWREWALSQPASKSRQERELLAAYERLGTADEYRVCSEHERAVEGLHRAGVRIAELEEALRRCSPLTSPRSPATAQPTPELGGAPRAESSTSPPTRTD